VAALRERTVEGVGGGICSWRQFTRHTGSTSRQCTRRTQKEWWNSDGKRWMSIDSFNTACLTSVGKVKSRAADLGALTRHN